MMNPWALAGAGAVVTSWGGLAVARGESAVNVDGDAIGVPMRISSAQAEKEWRFLKSFVPACNRVWTGPSVLKTVDTVYAPVLGNGGMVGCLDGGDGFLSYYLRSTDFWSDDGLNRHDLREIPAAHLRISENSAFTASLQKAWASSEITGDEAAGHAFDGLTSTKWCTKGPGPHWLAVDLGRVCTIRRWVVKHCSSDGASAATSSYNTPDFKLQKSDDGEHWSDVDSVTDNTESVTDRKVSALQSQYVRLYVTKATSLSDDNHARIQEFHVYSCAEEGSKAAPYRQEEEILDAEVRSDIPVSDGKLDIVSYIAATENTLVTRVTNRTAEPTRVSAQLSDDFLDRSNYPAKASVDGNVLCYTRETRNRPDARWVSRLGFALRVFGVAKAEFSTRDVTHGSVSFALPAGATATIITCMDGGKNAENPLAMAKGRVVKFDAKAITAVQAAHHAWWRNDWWLRSFVRIDEDVVNSYYYRMLYQLGTMCREGGVNSGLHGAWKASDSRHNYSSYCLNDLGASRFYIPLMMANRPATAKMWVQTMDDWIPYGQQRAKEVGLRGIYLPCHIGPWGATYEATYHGQKFLATNASLIGKDYYLLTGDTAYLKAKIYPFMLGCADFYESWLKKEADGKYHVQGASYESLVDTNTNSCLDLALARVLFTDIIEFSKVLGADADRRAKWSDIRDNLNDFSTQTYNGKTVYKADDQTPFNSSRNVLSPQIISPGYTCNRFSDPATQKLGYNTMLETVAFGSWDQGNMICQDFWMAAQRIGGFDVGEMINHFKKMLVKNNYIEFPNYMGGSVPWGFNQQLCVQAYPEGLLFFPDFPAQRRATFARIRLPGAFLASGKFADGQARNLTLWSEMGNRCTVFNPWGSQSPMVVVDESGARLPLARDGERYHFETKPGKAYRIERK